MRNVNTVMKWGVALCTTLSMLIINSHDVSAQSAKIVDRNGEVLQGSVLQETGGAVSEQDSMALVAIYHAFDGDNWDDNSGWLVERVEFWIGVDEVREIEVSAGVFEWRVTMFNLRSNFLVGEIPAEIGMLDRMERFEIRQNQIIGTIPREVEGMTEIRRLNVSNNPLMTGELPWEELVSLPNMTHLQATYNNFNGEIPEIVSDFPVLTNFALQASPFTGEFPDQLSQVETLQQVTLSMTYLTGPYPESFADLPELGELYLLFNPFLEAGPIPQWICEHESINQLRISASNRRGEIPACLAEMPSIERIAVGGPSDELTGTIPDLTFAEGLDFLQIWDSDITGPIPEYLGEMPALSVLYLKGINVSGTIPQSLASAPSLSQIYLKDLPNLEGPMPDFRNLNLTRFRIQNLGFDIGPIPDWIETQTGMSQMRLMNVGLTGEIPESWSALTNLQWLKVEGNPGLTGTLPSWVTEGNQMLREIRLGGTNIDLGADGQIPEWLCDMSQLQHIRLNDMGLTGTIPECLSELTLLGTQGDVGRYGWIPHAIDLSNNELTGGIPASLGNLQLVNGIDLSNNQLSGDVPEEFFSIGRIGEATMLQVLDLSGNPGLTGSISTDITNYNPAMLRIANFNDTGLCEPNDAAVDSWIDEMNAQVAHPITFMGIGGRSLKRAPTKCDGTPTSVEPEGLAYNFRLNQNYPNPFNPVTTIRYEIPENVQVTLTVYNVVGQRVATLINELQSAGQYDVNFEASNLASGTYIYRLEAGEQMLTQTMMLIK